MQAEQAIQAEAGAGVQDAPPVVSAASQTEDQENATILEGRRAYSPDNLRTDVFSLIEDIGFRSRVGLPAYQFPASLLPGAPTGELYKQPFAAMNDIPLPPVRYNPFPRNPINSWAIDPISGIPFRMEQGAGVFKQAIAR